jgi:hypothetical protein
MERKRKLPARAAARVEHVAKKRTVTPPEQPRSVTPAPAPPVEEPPAPLPKSIQSGKPLPTVEDAQPEDLPTKEYQSLQERYNSIYLCATLPLKHHIWLGLVELTCFGSFSSGVLAESLHRSRNKWVAEGLFEKYWSKPVKRKGVITEDPKNPPKDSMTKLGQVTITIEPHVFEATLFAVKDPKPAQTAQASSARPILQYGPPNGMMPPPKTPAATPATPATVAQKTPTTAQAATTQPSPKPQEPHSRPQSSATNDPPKVSASPRGMESVLTPTTPVTASQAATRPATATTVSAQPSSTPQPAASVVTASPVVTSSRPAAPAQSPATTTAKPAAKQPSGTDPIIVTLAEKASEDPQLRDLMKRVAVGEAKPDELATFQKIIDQITAEYKKKGGQQGPPADRLLVDGRTVKYFADEVRTILDIVLASNPQQKSRELRPPPGSDPLVVLLVKTALDEPKTKDMIKRIADGKPGYSDAADLKAVLERLHKEIKTAQQPATASAKSSPVVPNGVANGHPTTPAAVTAPPTPATPMTQTPTQPAQQSLRSKGPPPLSRPDISAIVLEFAGGTGDRYLFPKYSILEYLPGGQQILASFLIVRKGSASEYGGDPTLDYYQPVTVRIYAPTGRHLEQLARVVAPQPEVRRYMDDIMDNMTRAEYVLLAMRLPRVGKDDEKAENATEEANTTNRSTPKPETAPSKQASNSNGVLWTTKARSPSPGRKSGAAKKSAAWIEPLRPAVKLGSLRPEYSDGETDRYHKLTQSLAAKAPEGA